jgi:nitroimidazol reductase NimA-like FMN-containing flavoprotein (pyridoxamine 5'-phosphate oxidase superfamily)
MGSEDGSGTGSLSREECFALLATTSLGRLGATSGALPIILPVCFALHGDRLVFQTVPGTTLDVSVAGAVVAFESDSFGEQGQAGWRVLLQGVASEVRDQTVLEEFRSLGLPEWAAGEGNHRVFIMEPVLADGRWFQDSSQGPSDGRAQ